MTDADGIRFNALRNALYHTARRRFYERLDRVFTFAVIALGTVAVSDVLAARGISQGEIAAVIAIAGALQLVFGFGGQARDHQALQRDYYRLLGEIEAVVAPGQEDIARWRGELVRITADEPPMMRAVDAKAYNDAIDGLGVYDGEERLMIPWHHGLFGQVFSFEGMNYRKAGEA